MTLPPSACRCVAVRASADDLRFASVVGDGVPHVKQSTETPSRARPCVEDADLVRIRIDADVGRRHLADHEETYSFRAVVAISVRTRLTARECDDLTSGI